MTVKLLVGDTRERIKEIPDGDIDFLCCSPPFLALRKYGDNAAEMGSERTPADFLDALLELTGELRRVLAPHGSIAIELGDTYAGDDRRNGETVDIKTPHRHEVGRAGSKRANVGNGWPLAKSLTLIPTLYPASLAYGWNMLNPAHTFDRWRVRNLLVWVRPNPPVGALGDKVRQATSYITVACTSAKRWFDLDAVRGPASENTNARLAKGVESRPNETKVPPDSSNGTAPPLDWWEDDDPTGHITLILPTQPYPGAHYATWPESLAARLIKMMCPLRVCTTCGEPSRRIVGEAEYVPDKAHRNAGRMFDATRAAEGVNQWEGTGQNKGMVRQTNTLGWSDCGHDTWRPGRVLDPFAGSGTTLAVAQGLGRDAIGIELYEANAHLVRERVGMFLEMA